MDSSFSAFPTLGILGGGQLGRMTAMAAMRLGVRVRFLAPKAAGPMQGLGTQIVGDWKDDDLLREFAEGCTVVTVESEWAPADELTRVLPEGVLVWPKPETLRLIRDKGIQKETLAQASLPVPPFKKCATREDAVEAADAFGYPVLLKKYRGSYDGYGNTTVRDESELRDEWDDYAAHDGLLVEAFVDFKRELSLIVARRPDGDHRVYPVAHTIQREHQCHAVIVPADLSPRVEQRAREVGLAAVETVDGVGITAVELFETAGGEILINELAPRPHNTGHYSIEGSHTSQFENHVRAVLDWPLGNTQLRAPYAVMVNIIGGRDGKANAGNLPGALGIPSAGVHLYGKPDVRPRRKMGHVTLTGSDPEVLLERAEKAAALSIL